MNPAPQSVETFVARWDGSEEAERGNKDSFLNELCDVLGVDRPEPAKGGLGDYRFERAVTRHELGGETTPRRIDLYKRDCFLLEAKQGNNRHRQGVLFGDQDEHRSQGAGWARRMLEAKGQAERYARDLSAEEGWPPFLMVCDVGFCFELYADFTGTGKHYAQSPDRDRFRICLPDLRGQDVRERLRLVWTAPRALDPGRLRGRKLLGLMTKRAGVALRIQREGGVVRSEQGPGQFVLWKAAR
jgi:hypothetical protein